MVPFRSRLPVTACLIALLTPGCGEEVGLSVGSASFSRSELLGLSDSQVSLLSMIAALGLATAQGEVAVAGEVILDDQRRDLLIERLRQETMLELRDVTDGVLEARYVQSPQYELTVRHLVILSERWRSEDERETARARATVALERARAGESFPDLAGEVSEEPGAEARGGLLEPGREGSWVDEFWQAAHALEVGEISDVVESEYGFHVLRLDGREPVPFSEARGQVVADLAAQLDDPEAWRARVAEWTGSDMDSRSSTAATNREREVLLAEAERRSLTISEPDEARILRQWEFRAGGWATAFGFQGGMTPDAVATQALGALGRTDQAARIAREEILEVGDALLAAYPIQTPEP